MDFWDPHEQDTGVFSDTYGSVLGNDGAAWRRIAARSGLEGSQTPKTPNLHGKSLVRSLGGASQARGDLNIRKSLYLASVALQLPGISRCNANWGKTLIKD